MFVLFHLIFQLVKISILACIYGALILLVFRILGLFHRDGWFYKISKDKFKFWFTSICAISVVLFLFMFTYWGDHGLGDSSRTPIGHGQAIYNGDGSWTYFYPNLNKDQEQIFIGDYAVTDNKLCAKASPDFQEDSEFAYIVYDLESKKYLTFNSDEDYAAYAKSNNLPTQDEFYSFLEHYDEYWNGWRFWVMA